jgi:hypothetical protein
MAAAFAEKQGIPVKYRRCKLFAVESHPANAVFKPATNRLSYGAAFILEKVSQYNDKTCNIRKWTRDAEPS